jgi:two-component system chemotaxis response regulator CheB
MAKLQRAIVIGASAGGVEALKEVSRIPADLPVPVFVAVHIPPLVASSLPEILSKAGPLSAVHAQDGAKVKAGSIYVAPLDHHLLIENSHMAVKKGPKENRFRPSIESTGPSLANAAQI